MNFTVAVVLSLKGRLPVSFFCFYFPVERLNVFFFCETGVGGEKGARKAILYRHNESE